MRTRSTSAFAAGLCLVAGTTWAQPPHARVVRASAPPGGDGLTWASAFSDLQAGLDAAALQPAVTELWVAEGTYAPTLAVTADPRSKTFALRDGLALYGGFAGTELKLSLRDPASRVTILSGGPVPAGQANVYHVVSASGTDRTAVLDGFTVSGGYAARLNGPGPDSDNRGGGIWAEPGSPTLVNLRVIGNRAGSGGGAYLSGSPLITDSRFESNNVANVQVFPGQNAPGTGGGLFLLGDGVLARTTIVDNLASHGGGGYISGPATLVDCVVTSNDAILGAPNGGGLHLAGGPQLTDCAFTSNGGVNNFGGGVYGSGTFTRCVFFDNRAEDGSAIRGGGVFKDCQFLNNPSGGVGVVVRFTQAATLVRCLFDGNHTGSFGNGIIDGGQYESCVFSNNHASVGAVVSGGPFVNCLFRSNRTSSATLLGGGPFTNCTIVGNQNVGPGITRIATGTMTNCILWGNSSGLPQPYSGAINYSTLQGWDGSLGGVGNTANDPQFVDAAGGDYRLLAASSAIDSGSNSALPAGVFTDLELNGRFFDAPTADTGEGSAPMVDRGCYEFGARPFCYGNIDGSTSLPALNVQDFAAYLNLFAAGHPLSNCDTSTTSPTLNVQDFACFLNAFAVGCS